ncbi:MAG: IPT/TIG domain-containing protein [Actinobacteria bacterium]|nr:IPT/TIG domain-containing protein [Actinomycetota bacterium]
MLWQRPGRRALIATLTVVAALLPISSIAAVSALGDAPGGGGNSGAGPAIVGFSPHEGTIAGGTVVHISGGGFTGVSGVSFGGHAAQSFKVRSDNVIDAVTPRVPRGAKVRIHVAAASGAATSNATFAFIGCHVPRLKDDTVRQARREVAEAGCKTGQVRRANGARGALRVIAVSPPPGTWHESGTRVAITVR